MQVSLIDVSPIQATEALTIYQAHRQAHDPKDLEIVRIYRAIAKGKRVISVQDSIVAGGVDERRRPRLAICQADAEFCRCRQDFHSGDITFGIANPADRWKESRKISIRWPKTLGNFDTCRAVLPRIPPQFRPVAAELPGYHILWEADWVSVPQDPMLLRRIGKDAWVVLAAWDLTPVEMNVLRATSKRPQ
jgi:hypothetical protein